MAAEILSTHYGQPREEYRACGKKVDIFFQKEEFGHVERIYVEAKDYGQPLGRSDVVHICVDYEGILKRNAPCKLIIVTRNGLHTDARTYLEEERTEVRHQTLSEIENASLNLNNYMHTLMSNCSGVRLDDYYIEAGFEVRCSLDESLKAFDQQTLGCFDQESSAISAIREWLINEDDFRPLAILGGYGSGKTSVATKLAAEFAEKALDDPTSRQPIVLKLGEITHFSSIEGILGGHFTHSHPVPNFNFSNFSKLNEKGRYIIILDGFDEMKHAMSWADFRQMIRTLLKLKSDRSKIVLLGRPSSLISEEEERYVLKGQRRMKDNWVNLPDWPKFHEIALLDFSPEERKSFINKYLMTFLSEAMPDEGRQSRAELTNQIADKNLELFKKPVHSKILTDLAIDVEFDLDHFRRSFSRWDLYQSFIEAIYDREAEKSARTAISSEHRLKFLEDIAFWLWAERDAATSFEVGQIPRSIRSDIALWDDDLAAGVREMLTGSILEKKGYETYYFGHRSFAEFLVASRMYRRTPAANEHEKYSSAFADGVKDFLLEADGIPNITDWVQAFSSANGSIRPEYILLLADACGGMRDLKQGLSPASFWTGVLTPYKVNFFPSQENRDAVVKALRSSNSAVFSWHVAWLLDNGAAKFGWTQGKFNQVLFVALVSRVFSSVKFKDRRMTISEDLAGFKGIARLCLTPFSFDNVRREEDKYELELDFAALANAVKQELDRCGVPWVGDVEVSIPNVSFKVSDVKKLISDKVWDNWIMFHKHIRSFPAIVEIASKRRGEERRMQRSGRFQNKRVNARS
ncbi:NACHT domain-containing protein [Leisingera sp.]|uniref:NACHT domain-containing protein n=1 Tax=Leisingera sp. TaxID=1879318 RepID=UPI002B266ED7|nr:NACHT domain-containing protein [Leisingera sp.]